MFYYMGLESYKERYTYQLRQWTEARLKELGVEYTIVEGENLGGGIRVGQVLDAHGRSHYSLTQTANLIKLLPQMTADDVIFYEDMFTPGIECLGYIFNQVKVKPRVFVRCLAQTIDPDDFVHCTGMYKWMHRFEQLTNEIVDGILCTSEEMVAYAKVAGWTKLYNIGGLSFGKHEVQSRVAIPDFADRPITVTFASRLDREKQIPFLLSIYEELHNRLPNVNTEILCGYVPRSNDPLVLPLLAQAECIGIVKVWSDLSKNDYYTRLANSRVMVNTSLQDWVSNTVSEADALGCNVVFPAYRSFPEVFRNDAERMYVPWSVDDAVTKIVNALKKPSPHIGMISDWNDKTIDRIIDCIYHNPKRYDRSSLDYRSHINGL